MQKRVAKERVRSHARSTKSHLPRQENCTSEMRESVFEKWAAPLDAYGGGRGCSKGRGLQDPSFPSRWHGRYLASSNRPPRLIPHFCRSRGLWNCTPFQEGIFGAPFCRDRGPLELHALEKRGFQCPRSKSDVKKTSPVNGLRFRLFSFQRGLANGPALD